MTLHMLRDLQSLQKKLMEMCAAVEEIVHLAVDGLRNPSKSYQMDLIRRDDEVDEMDIEILDSCLKCLALNQPVAADLRRIVMIMKISNELERVADLAINLSERAEEMSKLGQAINVGQQLTTMADSATEMLRNSINSYVEEDDELARKVCGDDDYVDQLNKEIIDSVTQEIRANPDNVDTCMHLFSASRHIERIGDHATNIAEEVIYMITGEILRNRQTAEPSN